ncbi:MAG: methyltransferase domain-containing protein [Acidobacteriota bacterium]|nr:methyltransferase domain-containing protein [Acidobacteriota bacterium]
MMRLPIGRLLAMLLVVFALIPVAAPGQETSVRPGVNDSYKNPDVDQWVGRLEGEERAIYQYRYAIVAALGLRSGMRVADIGAGTGFLTRLMAEEVGDEGRVYAMDVVPEFLEHIGRKAAASGLDQIETVLGDQHSTGLEAGSVDLALVCDTYHHFEFPRQTLASIHASLADEGTLVVIDFERIEGVSPPFALSHMRAGRGTFSDEIRDAGFDLVKEIPLMDEVGQYYLVFKKRR